MQSRDGKIKVTSKGKQILDLAPQVNISIINCRVGRETIINRKGRYNSRHFIDEMKAFTQSIVNTIKIASKSISMII